MDVLADVLNTMQLKSAVQFCMELTAPWGIKAPAMPDSAIFFVVTRGSCYLEVDRVDSPVSLVGGDLVMLPHGVFSTIYQVGGYAATDIRHQVANAQGQRHLAPRFSNHYRDCNPRRLRIRGLVQKSIQTGDGCDAGHVSEGWAEWRGWRMIKKQGGTEFVGIE